MAKRKLETGLGRGLDALFGDPDLPAQGEGSVSLPISQVEPGLNQPRKRFDPESLADLAESIRVHGVIQPLTVPSSSRRTTERSWSWVSSKTCSGRT